MKDGTATGSFPWCRNRREAPRKAAKTALFEAAKRREAGAVRAIATTLPALARATDAKGKSLGEKDGTRVAAAMLAPIASRNR